MSAVLDPVTALAMHVWPEGGFEEYLMFHITGSFDDAGTDQNSKVQVMAGYIALVQQWQRFYPKWRELLNDYNIPHFHAFKFAGRKPPYRDWGKEKKRQFVFDAATILKNDILLGAGVYLRNEDYQEIYRQGAPIRKVRMDSKRALCFRVLILRIADLLDSHPRTKDARIQFVVDKGTKNAGDLLRVMDELKLHGQGQRKAWSVAGLDFAYAAEFSPLQVADLFAFCLKQDTQSVIEAIPSPMLNTLLSASETDGKTMHLKFPVTREMLARMRLGHAFAEGRIIDYGKRQHEQIMERIANAKAGQEKS